MRVDSRAGYDADGEDLGAVQVQADGYALPANRRGCVSSPGDDGREVVAGQWVCILKGDPPSRHPRRFVRRGPVALAPIRL